MKLNVAPMQVKHVVNCVYFPSTEPGLRLNIGVFLSTHTERRARELQGATH